MEQELGHKIWTIVELFYRSHLVFRDQFDNYEKLVLEYSRSTGIHRDELRLNSTELASLLDLKSLERLRDGYMFQLKDLCHLVFRGHDRTDLLDRYVSDIFHEISILKEEHYDVKIYASLYERDAAEVELKHILDEAHALFPQKLHHIRYLFGRALARLEEHLPSFSKIQLFIRSLYLHRDDFVKDVYADGLDHFYWLMYPLGPLEGYYDVGVSFYHSGFFLEALEAFRSGEEAYRKALLSPADSFAKAIVENGAAESTNGVVQSRPLLTSAEGRRRARAILNPLRRKAARLTALAAAGPRREEAMPLGVNSEQLSARAAEASVGVPESSLTTEGGESA